MNSLEELYESILKSDWAKVEEICPWFRELEVVPQDAIWHAEGNVLVHTKMVIEALVTLPEFKRLSEEKKTLLTVATLFHDIEKRSTTTVDIVEGAERIVSPNHSKKGARTTQSILYREFNIDFEKRQEIVNLARYHGLPVWAINKSNPQKSVIEVSLKVNTELLYILAKADFIGRISDEKETSQLRIELFKELCMENNCFGKPRVFQDDFSRYFYLNKEGVSPDYKAYDKSEFEVIMMSGLPGSGKDTYIQKHLNLPVVSLDDIRKELNVDPTDKKGNGRAIQIGKERAKKFLRRKEPFVFNGTNITRSIRSTWLNLFHEYKARVRIIYVEVPYNQLLIQNSKREDAVPLHILERLVKKLEIPEPMEAHNLELHT